MEKSIRGTRATRLSPNPTPSNKKTTRRNGYRQFSTLFVRLSITPDQLTLVPCSLSSFTYSTVVQIMADNHQSDKTQDKKTTDAPPAPVQPVQPVSPDWDNILVTNPSVKSQVAGGFTLSASDLEDIQQPASR
jgi:hypothetical protein